MASNIHQSLKPGIDLDDPRAVEAYGQMFVDLNVKGLGPDGQPRSKTTGRWSEQDVYESAFKSFKAE